MFRCTQQTVPCTTGTQTATFSQLICAPCLEYLRPNLLELIQKKLYYEQTHEITNRFFLKSLRKNKFKMAEVERDFFGTERDLNIKISI